MSSKISSLLIGIDLRDQQCYTELRGTENTPQPRHFYEGFGFACRLLKHAKLVMFTNVELAVGADSGVQVASIGRARRAQRFWGASTVLGYSLSGCLIVCAAKILRPRMQRVLVLFSGPNPEGTAVKRWLREIIYRLGVWGATDLVAFSKAVPLLAEHWGAACRIWYSPVTADYNYFDRAAESPRAPVECSRLFCLVVGDSTRDDAFIYESLKSVRIPILRISRDPLVVMRVGRIQNLDRGDRILSRVPFEVLARLYREAALTIYVSRFDAWQPAGATSLSECLASGGIALAEGGGMIEADFRFLCGSGEKCPIRFFPRRDPVALASEVKEIVALGDRERNEWRNQSRSFAASYLDVERSLTMFDSVLEQKDGREK